MKVRNVIDLKKIMMYFLAISIALQCHTLLSVIWGNSVFIAAVIILLILLTVFEGALSVNKKDFIFLSTYLLSMSVIYLAHGIEQIGVVGITCSFPLMYIFLKQKRNALDFFECFTNVVTVILGISIFFYFFGSVFNVVEPTAYYPSNFVKWGPFGYLDYYHLYNEAQTITFFGFTGVRNISLFLEAPMMVYPGVIAYAYEMLIREKKRKIVVLILVVALMLSFSTTAYIMLAAVFFWVSKDRISGIIKKGKFVIITIMVLLVIMLAYELIQNKLIEGNGSLQVRTDDIRATILCFINNPIAGVGFGNTQEIDPYRLISRANAGLSTGVGGVLVYGGLLWGIWFLIPVYRAITFLLYRKVKKSESFFVLFLFVLLGVTVVQDCVIATFMNAIAWCILDRQTQFVQKN